MNEVNLLFLAPHWRVTLVRAFQESWSRGQIPGRLIGADSDPEAPALKILPWAYRLPEFSDPLCLNELQEICRRENVRAIIPMTNKAIEFLDRHRDAIRSMHLHLYVAPAETVACCHDKLKLAERFQDPDGPCRVPRTWLAGQVPEDARLPLIAKERYGEGSRNVFYVESPRDLTYFTECLRRHVFQECIDGAEYSIDWFGGRDGTVRLVVPRERLAVRGGEVMKSRIRLNNTIIDAARALGETLKLNGPATLQGLLDRAGRFWLTDVNLRFGSGYVHSIAAGADLPLLIHRELCGQPVDEVPLRVTDGSVMVRYPDHLLL